MDPDQYRQAEELDAAHPYWWILWAPYNREYTAFFLGPSRVEPIDAKEPQDLCAKLARAEHEEFAPPVALLRSSPRAPGVG